MRHEKTAGLERNLNRAANAGVPLHAGLLLISPIAGIQGGFANALKVEMGADNASRVKEAE
ncbi:MAG: hypothetical protein WC593_10490 [Methanoregula sp.]